MNDPVPISVRVTLHTVGSCRASAWLADGARTFARRTFPALVVRLLHPARGVVLFDTGYGVALSAATSPAARIYRRVLPFSLPPEQQVDRQLAQAEVAAREIAMVFLSHFHPDHVGGLRALPGAPIVCSRDGLAGLRALGAVGRLRNAFLPELLPDDFAARASAIEDLPRVALGGDWAPFEHAHDLFGDGALRAVALPGHALGQYGLICRLAGGRELFLVADAAWSLANVTELALPAWPARRLLGDAPTLVETLRKLHALALRRPELLIVPSHCEASQHTLQRVIGGHAR